MKFSARPLDQPGYESPLPEGVVDQDDPMSSFRAKRARKFAAFRKNNPNGGESSPFGPRGAGGPRFDGPPPGAHVPGFGPPHHPPHHMMGPHHHHGGPPFAGPPHQQEPPFATHEWPHSHPHGPPPHCMGKGGRKNNFGPPSKDKKCGPRRAARRAARFAAFQAAMQEQQAAAAANNKNVPMLEDPSSSDEEQQQQQQPYISSPPASVHFDESTEGYLTIAIDVTGFDVTQLKVQMEGRDSSVLSIRGERTNRVADTIVLQKRFNIDQDLFYIGDDHDNGIRCKFGDGVLEVILKKKPEPQPRPIMIEALDDVLVVE